MRSGVPDLAIRRIAIKYGPRAAERRNQTLAALAAMADLRLAAWFL